MKYKGLLSLVDIPEGLEKEVLIMKMRLVHKPSKKYLKNGYRFMTSHMKQIGGGIIMLPIECIADYVPLDIKDLIDGNDADTKRQIQDLIKSEDLFYLFQHMQADTLGIYAYATINYKDKKASNAALDVLLLYNKYFHVRLQNDRDGLKKLVQSHKKRISK